MIKNMIMRAKNVKNLMDAESNKNEKFLDNEQNTEKYLTGLKDVYEYFNSKQKITKSEDKELPQFASMAVMAGFCYAKSMLYAKKGSSLIHSLCTSILINNLPYAPKEEQMSNLKDKIKSVGNIQNVKI